MIEDTQSKSHIRINKKIKIPFEQLFEVASKILPYDDILAY